MQEKITSYLKSLNQEKTLNLLIFVEDLLERPWLRP